ncbi:MAG: DUF6569 family protein [Verrucomicrobiota bacterium]
MENVVAGRLQSLSFGVVQRYKNIAILPLLASDGAFRYRALGEALATSDIAITEVSAAGAVPELLVINRGKTPVLLIDGEELAGAKQNRVLNTSILLKELSETRIPVRCTEQGRWSYASPAFTESGNVMAQKARAQKSRSVSRSLETSASYLSNQGEVWHGIQELQTKACCYSPTSAMGDVFKAREADLQRCAEIFQSVPGQIGLLAFTDDRPAGLDLVSLSSAYAVIHPKLIRSYALESLLESSRPERLTDDFDALAKTFLGRVVAANEQRFPSVGCGFDCRYRGEALAGAALVHCSEVIHSALFQLETAGPTNTAKMAPLGNRRRYHRE